MYEYIFESIEKALKIGGLFLKIYVVFAIIYGIICFLAPIFTIIIYSNIKNLKNEIKELKKQNDDIAYILIHQVDAKTADKEFDNNMEE